MGDYFSEIHSGLCLFQQFLLINLVGFSFIVSVNLKQHLHCNIYLHLKPAAFIDKILILHCFNHPSISNVLQQKKCRNERNVLYEGSRDLNGRKYINQFNKITQTVKKSDAFEGR